MKKEKHNICRKHNLPIAPYGPSLLVTHQDYLRIQELKLTREEMKNMNMGKMALRHFTYDTWCENRTIAWL